MKNFKQIREKWFKKYNIKPKLILKIDNNLKMKICTCLNCNEVYEDLNPGKESNNYPEEDLDQLRYIQIQKEEAMWACPKCLTDEFLIDNKQ